MQPTALIDFSSYPPPLSTSLSISPLNLHFRKFTRLASFRSICGFPHARNSLKRKALPPPPFSFMSRTFPLLLKVQMASLMSCGPAEMVPYRTFAPLFARKLFPQAFAGLPTHVAVKHADRYGVPPHIFLHCLY